MPSYRQVLLVRIDKVGDMLLTMPAIRAVRDALPDARLTVLASPYNAVAIGGWGVPDEVVTYDRAWPLSARWSVARRLRRSGFDACLVFSPGLEEFVVARLTGAPVRVGLVYSRRVLDRVFSPALLTAACILRVDEGARRGEALAHMVEQTMEAVVRAGLPAGRGDLEVVGSEAAATWANACLSQHAAAARSLVGLHVSSKWFESGWTADDLVDLMQRLLTADSGRAIVLTWGPGDRVAAGSLLDAAATRSDGRALSPAVAGDPTHGARAVLAGRALLVAVDFPRWAALLSRCDVIVTRDTASLHLASALGRPVVAVYAVAGFVRNSQQFAPWRVAHAIVRDGPFGTVGQEVVEAVGRLVGASPRRGSARP